MVTVLDTTDGPLLTTSVTVPSVPGAEGDVEGVGVAVGAGVDWPPPAGADGVAVGAVEPPVEPPVLPPPVDPPGLGSGPTLMTGLPTLGFSRGATRIGARVEVGIGVGYGDGVAYNVSVGVGVGYGDGDGVQLFHRGTGCVGGHG